MDGTLPATLDAQRLRLALLRELGQSLAKSQSAVLSFDLERFESETVRQTGLCRELARLEKVQSAEQRAAEAGLRYQVRLYAALLRRVRRTVEIFCRVLSSSGVTYSVPGAR